MPVASRSQSSEAASYRSYASFRPGDLVTTRTGYPVLYEILSVECDGVLRVRGLNWAPGYSANVSVEEVRPVNSSLAKV